MTPSHSLPITQALKPTMEPLQLIGRTALSCLLPGVICILTEISREPKWCTFRPCDRLWERDSRACPLAHVALVMVGTVLTPSRPSLSGLC